MTDIKYDCGDCRHIKQYEQGKRLSVIDCICTKYNKPIVFYDWWLRDEQCLQDNGIDELSDGQRTQDNRTITH